MPLISLIARFAPTVRKRILGTYGTCMALLAALCICCSHTHNDAGNNDGESLTAALARADSLADRGEAEDAVFLYGQIAAAGEMRVSLSDSDANAALTAALLEAQMYFNHYTDYGRELESLNRARRIADLHGLPVDGVDFLMGELFFTVAEQHRAQEYFDRGAECFARLLLSDTAEEALRHDAASNLILYAQRSKPNTLLHKALDTYFDDARLRGAQDFKFNVMLSELTGHMRNHRPRQAMATLERIRNLSDIPMERILPGLYFISGQIAHEEGRDTEALQYLKTSESLVDPEFGSDMELEVFEALADVYASVGNRLAMGEYAEKANKLRRQLSSFSQISSFKRAEMQEEMDALETVLSAERNRSRRLGAVLAVTAVAALVIAAVAGMLVYFVRKLRAKNRVLYMRYVELLRVHPVKAVAHEDLPLKGEAVHETEDTAEHSVDSVDPGDRDADEADVEVDPWHIEAIENVFNGEESIFSADFSAASLSVLTGIKPRTLSAVIATHYGVPFRTLLNQRRIRAVCMTLESDSRYDNLTVDAIADSVGIKSRTTFVAAFRRETGMTPAQYIRFARKRKESLIA